MALVGRLCYIEASNFKYVNAIHDQYVPKSNVHVRVDAADRLPSQDDFVPPFYLFPIILKTIQQFVGSFDLIEGVIGCRKSSNPVDCIEPLVERVHVLDTLVFH